MHREVEGLGGKEKTGGNNGKMKKVCEVSDAISFRAVLQVFAAIYFQYQRFVLLNLILCSWVSVLLICTRITRYLHFLFYFRNVF